MSRTLITDIAESLKSGADDNTLNTVIQQHIASFGLGISYRVWREQHYDLLRQWAYPNIEDYYNDFPSYVSLREEVDERFPAQYPTIPNTVKVSPLVATAGQTTVQMTDISDYSHSTVEVTCDCDDAHDKSYEVLAGNAIDFLFNDAGGYTLSVLSTVPYMDSEDFTVYVNEKETAMALNTVSFTLPTNGTKVQGTSEISFTSPYDFDRDAVRQVSSTSTISFTAPT